MASDSAQAQPVEPTTAPTEIDIAKRDTNGGSGENNDGPPSKKARLEDFAKPNGHDHPLRQKGIAPIKAE